MSVVSRSYVFRLFGRQPMQAAGLPATYQSFKDDGTNHDVQRPVKRSDTRDNVRSGG